MSENSSKIWFDGELVPWEDANIHVLTHTLHYGLGVFEGIRAYHCENGKTAIFKLDKHIKRLFDSCHIAEIKVPFDHETLKNATINLLKVNELKEAYIRPIIFIGHGTMGVNPQENPIRVAIAAWPWGAYLGDDGLSKGIRVKISSYTRMDVNSFMTKAKICGNYVNSVFAKKEAISLGFDEAIMLDTDGYIAEGSGENVFIVRNGVVKTPPLTSILEGITRNFIFDIAENENIKVVEQRFTRDEFYTADEVFLTGTAAEITPIREADGRKIGNGTPGEITKRLQERFFNTIKGKDKKFESCLTYI